MGKPFPEDEGDWFCRAAKRARFACSVALFCLVAFAALVALALLLCGCGSYRGGRIVEGTDVAVGVSLPQSGGQIQMDVLNYVSGFRFLFCEDAGVRCIYTATNSVSLFGVYESSSTKTVDIDLHYNDAAKNAADCEAK